MPVVREKMSPARHPWIEVFLANPDKEFADFLAGYARIEPYGRAETPDAARMLFGPLAPEDAARRKLDQAVAEWLDERRREGVPPAEGPRLDRKLREITDAIRIVSVLSLQHTAADFRRRFLLWHSWVEGLAGIAGPDVRAEFLSTLALTQRLVHKTASGINPFGLEPLWLRLCEQAGSQYPSSYLSIGLLGLRVLPERKDMPSERPWMAGLARWAAAQKPEVENFSRQWWALRALYPSTPGHWREAVVDTLQQKATENIAADMRDFWEKDVGLGKRSAQKEDARRGKRPRGSRPSRSAHISLLGRLGEPIRNIASEVKNHIEMYERDAEATGDNHFLVRSATNIGMRLIEFGPINELAERGSLAVDLARKALAWSPTDVYAWALWRDALETQGLYEAAELVGWEEIHRFPEGPEPRTQLALLLVRLPDRENDAERLLRETRNRFPQNAFAATQLAHVLAKRRDRKVQDEAETLLRGVIEHDPMNLVACFQLAVLLAKRRDRKGQDEAETLLRGVLKHDSGNIGARTQLAYVLVRRRDRKDQDEAETLLRGVLDHDLEHAPAHTQLALLLARRPDRKDQDEAERLLRDVRHRDADNFVASNQLAHLLAKRPDRKDQDEAERLLRDILHRDAGNVMASNQLARLLAERPDPKDQDEAERLLRDVLRHDPDDIVASRQLAYLLAKRPDRKDQGEAARPLTEPPDLPADIPTVSSQPTPSAAEQLELQHEMDRVLEESIRGSVDEAARALIEPADLPADITTVGSQPTPSHAEHLDVEQEMDRVLEESIRSSLDEAVAQSKSTTPPIVPTERTAKASVVPKAPTAATAARTRSERTDDDVTMALVRRGGRLRRLVTDLPRRMDDVPWRNAAAAEVERIFAEDKNFAYAQYLKNELGEDGAIESRAVTGGFAIAFIDAIKKKDPERFKDLESNHPAQSRLFDVARAYLGDRAAADRAVQWLNAPADAEPRSVAALRGFFEQRFGVKVNESKYRFIITDPEAFLNLVAANDNVRLDLIESALVPTDLALAA